MAAVDVKDARNGSFASCYLCVLLILMANTDRSSAGDQQVIIDTDDRITAEHDFVGKESTSKVLQNISARAFDPYRKCDVDYFERNFFLATPKYPQRYDNDLDCTYTIHRAKNVCKFELVFQSFELEESEGCLADYLEVNGRRFCSSLPSNASRTFAFTESEIRLRFRSDAVNTKQGFLLHGSQIACLNTTTAKLEAGETQQRSNRGFLGSFCDCSFAQPQFDISSPGFPAPYEPNLNCNYAIRKSSLDVCHVEVTFESLDLNFSPDCQNDYLEFDKQRLCFLGNVRTYYFEFDRPVFHIRFHSGANQWQRTGFRLRLRQLPCSVTPPSLPRPPVTLPVPSGNCLWELNEQETYSSDSIDGARALRFELHSPGYPGLYPNNQNCLRIIRKALRTVCYLEFVVRSFDLEVDPNCQNDFLSVGGKRFCGTLQSGTSRIFQFSAVGEIPIRFVSNADHSGGGFSLIFQQKECSSPRLPSPPVTLPPSPPISNQCDAMFTSASFQIASPRFVPFNTQCTYTIRKLSNIAVCALQISYVEFNFGYDNLRCSQAFLEVGGERLCEKSIQGTTRTYNFSSHVFVIRFWSGFQHPQFLLNVSQRLCLPDPYVTPLRPTGPYPLPWNPCGSLVGSHISSRIFQLRSPRYPDQYEANLNCGYVVARASPHVCRLQIQFRDFDLEESSECRNDFLEIGRVRLCGCQRIGVVKYFDFYDSELVIRLHSNHMISGRGFVMDALQLDCYIPPPNTLPQHPLPCFAPLSSACNRTYQTDEVTIQSELYPSPYPPGTNCHYIINKTRNNVCQLQVEFVFFQLGLATACGGGDFLDIGKQRHCGIIPSGTIRRYDFTLDWIPIMFTSQCHSTAGEGYLLRLRQILCSDFPAPTASPTLPYYPTSAAPDVNCNVISSKSEFNWASPNYPAPYESNQDCHLTIQRNNPSVCSLLIRFHHFDLETSLGCTKDYLQIFEQRFCGLLNVPMEKSFPFNEESLVLNFHSDSYGISSGFYATIVQKDCLDGPIFRISNALTLNATDRDLTTESAVEILTSESPSRDELRISTTSK